MNRDTSKPSPPRTMRTDLDDWETDPDFIRDMDETTQRWGSSRTVGSIKMNDLIDQVRKDHQAMRDKFNHSSQRDHSEGFGGKFGVQHDRRDQSAHDYDYHEELSRHSSQEIRKVISSGNGNIPGSTGGSSHLKPVSEVKKYFRESKSQDIPRASPTKPTKPTPPPYPTSEGFKSRFASMSNANNSNNNTTTSSSSTRTFSPQPPQSEGYYSATGSKLSAENPTRHGVIRSTSPGRFEELSSTVTNRVIKEKKSSSSLSFGDTDGKDTGELSPAYKSIQEKINAFKREFEDIENKMSRKSDLSKVIKKTTNVEKFSNVEYLTRSGSDLSRSPDPMAASSYRSSSQQSSREPVKTKAKIYDPPQTSRPTSTSPSTAEQNDIPSSSIRSLSEKFETLCKEDSDNFRRQTEAKRKEFFDHIKSQVRQTRKNLDGFDTIDDDADDVIDKFMRSRTSPLSYNRGQTNQNNSHSSSSGGSGMKPKVYTKSETTKEEFVSKIVKENDKIIENETKKNVERSSSVHGSSDEDDSNNPSSISYIDRKLRSSPADREKTESPVDEIKRRVPIIDPKVSGAGLMARALYDYQASEPDELSFDVDDLITNVEKIDVGWYRGSIINKDGRKIEGLFPANHVKLLNDSGEY